MKQEKQKWEKIIALTKILEQEVKIHTRIVLW